MQRKEEHGIMPLAYETRMISGEALGQSLESVGGQFFSNSGYERVQAINTLPTTS